jgi:hypothetical protein
MKLLATVLKVLGYVWLVLAGIVVVASLGMIWWKEGFSRLQEILSPFNVVNWVVTMITLAPGYGLLFLADKLKAKVPKE